MTNIPLHIGDRLPTAYQSLLQPGQSLLLYFYPKDDTPGCTIEAKGFRDHFTDFQAKGVHIVGVSRDNAARHQAFCEKYALPFPLYPDTEGDLCRLFDALKEKSMFGKKYLGIIRSTFLLDPTGVLMKEWRNVSAVGHVKAVLAAL